MEWVNVRYTAEEWKFLIEEFHHQVTKEQEKMILKKARIPMLNFLVDQLLRSSLSFPEIKAWLSYFSRSLKVIHGLPFIQKMSDLDDVFDMFETEIYDVSEQFGILKPTLCSTLSPASKKRQLVVFVLGVYASRLLDEINQHTLTERQSLRQFYLPISSESVDDLMTGVMEVLCNHSVFS